MARLSIQKFIHKCFPRHYLPFTVPRESTKTLHQNLGVQNDGHDLDIPKHNSTSDEAPEPTERASSTPSPNATDNEDTAPHPIISQPHSRILSLPAELRTMIYQIALTTDRNYIAITPTDHQQPPLLLVSRQIRHEAAHLYFKENAFGFHVIDLQPNKPKYGSGHWTVMNYKGIGMRDCEELWCVFSGRADWENLKEWLRLCYEGQMPALTPGSGAVGWMGTLGSVFRMVMRMREEEHPRTWEEVEGILSRRSCWCGRTCETRLAFGHKLAPRLSVCKWWLRM